MYMNPEHILVFIRSPQISSFAAINISSYTDIDIYLFFYYPYSVGLAEGTGVERMFRMEITSTVVYSWEPDLSVIVTDKDSVFAFHFGIKAEANSLIQFLFSD